MQQVAVHASSVAFPTPEGAFAVALGGASGSGKSALALRLMALGAELVSDDQTLVQAENGMIFASAPTTIQGLIEWRGVGMLPATSRLRAQLVAWVDMDRPVAARLPDPVWKTLLGVRVPALAIPAGGAGAAGLRQFMIGQAWRVWGRAE